MGAVENVRDSETPRFPPDAAAMGTYSSGKIDEEMISLSAAYAVDIVTDDSHASS